MARLLSFSENQVPFTVFANKDLTGFSVKAIPFYRLGRLSPAPYFNVFIPLKHHAITNKLRKTNCCVAYRAENTAAALLRLANILNNNLIKQRLLVLMPL
jgi:hypothetical protein